MHGEANKFKFKISTCVCHGIEMFKTDATGVLESETNRDFAIFRCFMFCLYWYKGSTQFLILPILQR